MYVIKSKLPYNLPELLYAIVTDILRFNRKKEKKKNNFVVEAHW